MSLDTLATNRLVFPSATEVFRSAQRLPLAPLVDAATQEQLLELVRDFPVPVQTVCYECRLREDDDRVDLALCMLPPHAGQENFTGALDELAASRSGDPHWRRTVRFLQNWAAMASGYRPEFPLVWLAFDLDKDMRTLPVPCPAPCVDQDFFTRRLGVTVASPSAPDMAVVASTCHQALLERPLTDDVRRLFLRCLSVEGVNVHAKHFSFMLSRQPATFKLDVQVPVEQIATFLRAIEWPGPAVEIEARIRHYMPWPGHVQLNLVLSPRLTAPLEVEFLSGGQEIAPEERLAFVGRLVETRLCSVEKARVLRNTWERRLLEAPGACESDIALNWYVKIRFQEDVATEAKAYVGLMPRLWRGSRERGGARPRAS